MLGNLIEFLSHGTNLAFFFFALIAIGGAIFMISFTKVIHMVIALDFTFLSLAGLYVLLEAEFIAFVQVLIYAGAVSILMIFGIMMTRHEDEENVPRRPVHQVLLGIGCIGLFLLLFYGIQQASFPAGKAEAVQDNTAAIGQLLFNQYVIPFELLSVLLTIAFIGAIILAKREED